MKEIQVVSSIGVAVADRLVAKLVTKMFPGDDPRKKWSDFPSTMSLSALKVSGRYKQSCMCCDDTKHNDKAIYT